MRRFLHLLLLLSVLTHTVYGNARPECQVDLFATGTGVSSSASQAQGMAVGDLDGAHTPDLVVLNFGNDEVWVHLATAVPGVYTESQIGVPNGPFAAVVADVDSDTYNDIVVTVENGDQVIFYSNTGGTGTFPSPPVVIEEGSATIDGPNGLCVGDFDGDSYLDLAVTGRRDYELHIFLNPTGTGPAGPAAQTIFTFNDAGLQTVACADFDADGDTDLALGSYNYDFVQILSNTGGTFSSVGYIDVDADGMYVLTTGDVDGQNGPDIVGGSQIDGTVALYANAGVPGSFSFFNKIVLDIEAPRVTSVTIADADNDGNMDIFAVAESINTLKWYKQTNVPRVFEPGRIIIRGLSAPHSVRLLDATGDGLPDVFYTQQASTPALSYVATAPPPPSSYNTGSNTFGEIYSVILINGVDVDGDGDYDLVVGDQSVRTISWHENVERGTFGPSQLIDITSNFINHILPADLNGDGAMDLVSIVFSTVRWYRNNGAGVFTTLTVFSDNTVEGGGRAVWAGDLDNDGDLDLVACFFWSFRMVWYENTDGEGTFSYPNVIEQASGSLGPTFVIGGVYDTTSDPPRVDVVLADHRRDDLVMYRNIHRNGTFAPADVFSNVEVTTMANADLDQDGDLDIFFVSVRSDVVGWYENPGDGVFTGSYTTITSSFSNPDHILIRDVDGDLLLDVMVHDGSTDSVYWFKNLGAASFGPASPPVVSANGIKYFGGADFDNDGDVDVALTRSSPSAYLWFGFDRRSAFDPDPTPQTHTGLMATAFECADPTSFACVAASIHPTSRCVGDTLLLPPGVYSCARHAHLAIDKELTIQAQIPGSVIFDCALPDSDVGGVLFRVVSPGSLTLRDITIRNMGVARSSLTGAPGLRVSGVGASLKLVNVTLEDATSIPVDAVESVDLGVGGAVLATLGASLTVEDSRILGCTASVSGGGIAVTGAGSDLDMKRTVVTSSEASLHGGGVFLGEGTRGVVVDSRFENNVAGVSGGGMCVNGMEARVNVSGGGFEGNSARHGGALAVLSPAVSDSLPLVTNVVDIPAGSSASAVTLAGAGANKVTLSSVAMGSNVGSMFGGALFVCDAHLHLQGGSSGLWTGNTASSSVGSLLFVCGVPADVMGPTGLVPSLSAPQALPWVSLGPGMALEGAQVGGALARLEWRQLPQEEIQAGEGLVVSVAGYDLFGVEQSFPSARLTLQLEANPVLSSSSLPEIQFGLTSSDLFVYVVDQESVPISVGVSVAPIRSPGGSGYDVPVLGGRSVTVTPCGPGFGGNDLTTEGGASSVGCVPCTGGTFSEEVSFAPCGPTPPCATGSVRVDGGNSSVNPCVCSFGFFDSSRGQGASDGSSCLPCPTGGFCTGGEAQPEAAPGFYSKTPGSTDFVACTRSGCSGDDQCSPGYKGYLCSECTEGYFSRSESECARCPSGAAIRFALAVVAIIVVSLTFALFVAWSSSRTIGAPTHTDSTSVQHQINTFRARTTPVSISMILVVFQVVSLLAETNLGWSSESKALLGGFGVFNIDAQAVAAECALSSFYVMYVLSIFAPVALLITTMVSVVVLKLLHNVIPFLSGLETLKARTLLDSVLFTLGPFLYLPIARASLILFDCSRRADGVYVLDVDNGVRCFDGSWWSVFPFGLLALVGYVVGIPVYFFLTLWIRKYKLFEPSVTTRFGSLYRNFRRTYFWTELLNLGKRLAIVVVALFFSKHQLAQILLLLTILLVSLLFTATQQPYYVPLYNAIEFRLTCVLIAILLLGTASYAERDRDSADVFFAAAAYIMFSVLLLVSLHSLVVDVLSLRTERKAVFYSVSKRKARLVTLISTELKDVESGPQLMHAANEFFASLDDSVHDRSRPRGDSISIAEVEMSVLK